MYYTHVCMYVAYMCTYIHDVVHTFPQCPSINNAVVLHVTVAHTSVYTDYYTCTNLTRFTRY